MTSYKHAVVICALLAITITLAHGQFLAEKLQNPCGTKITCHECIQTQSCAWCMDPNIGDKPRCFQPSINSCPEEFTWNPSNRVQLLVDEELTRGGQMAAHGAIGQGHGASYESSSSQQSYSRNSSASESYENMYARKGASGSHRSRTQNVAYGSYTESGRIIQIAPQRVSLKLRINEEHDLNIRYSQAEDYPVDLYYLMDLSNSMRDDKDKLSTLGDLLSETMRNITSNFRLGFGSFVDKVLMPYVSTVPKKLVSPCDGCEAPYGYRNHMPLSTDTAEFSEKVRSAAVSGNLDAPEGGFDAIMQAIVCRDQIGWRDQARRLLVFSTDSGFHYAGDGKLGGVITPNDGECHLNGVGEYTHSTILDYPSISQINAKVQENSINIIFAVTEQNIGVYNRLAERTEGAFSAVLSNDSSNVVDLVKEQYSKISSSIEMKDNATSALKITYYSSCKGNGPVLQTSKCDDLRVGDIVSFTAKIVVTSCPQNPSDWLQTFQIYPVGINESLIIDLEMLCDCGCEHPPHPLYERPSSKCNGHGTYKCGYCECDNSYFGQKCECSSLEIHNVADRDRGCRPDNITLIDCSGRGQCVCGVCECEKRNNPEEIISGKYCGCDNFSCDRVDGVLCGGADNGICECGSCRCKPGWTGDDCTCQISQHTCMPPNGGEICSGNGECVCGKCKCKETAEGRYSGRHCEKCPTCSGRCQEFKECVQCQMYKTGPMGNNPELCAANCTLFVPKGVEKLEVNDKSDDHLCVFFDENDCKFEFTYNDNDINNIKVTAKEKLECPTEVFILGIVMGVIASIVLLGLALLFLWKILTTIHDRREFAKFEKERQAAKWDTGENPIYKQATSIFKNPTYTGGNRNM